MALTTFNNFVAGLPWTKIRLIFCFLVISVTWLLAAIELCLCNQIKHRTGHDAWPVVVTVTAVLGFVQLAFAWMIYVFHLDEEIAASQNAVYNPSENHNEQSWWRRLRGAYRGYVATVAGSFNQAASLVIVAVVVANMSSTVHDEDDKVYVCGYDIHYFWGVECLVIWAFFWSIFLKAGPYMDTPLSVFIGMTIQIASQIKDEGDPAATIKCPRKPYGYTFGLSIAFGVVFILSKNFYGLYFDYNRASKEKNLAPGGAQVLATGGAQV